MHKIEKVCITEIYQDYYYYVSLCVHWYLIAE